MLPQAAHTTEVDDRLDLPDSLLHLPRNLLLITVTAIFFQMAADNVSKWILPRSYFYPWLADCNGSLLGLKSRWSGKSLWFLSEGNPTRKDTHQATHKLCFPLFPAPHPNLAILSLPSLWHSWVHNLNKEAAISAWTPAWSLWHENLSPNLINGSEDLTPLG